jgi:hypothetical protein
MKKTFERVGLDQPFNFVAWDKVAWCFVKANVEATASAIRDQVGAKQWIKNVGHNKELEVEGDYFVPFRVSGNAWTNFVGMLGFTESSTSPQLLRALSKWLKTQTIFAAYEGTSGIFGYRLYDRGLIQEVLHSDGTRKLTTLPRIRQPAPRGDFKPPAGFCFYSRNRTLRRGELTYLNIPRFFDGFLKMHGVFMVLETGDVEDGRFTFAMHRLKPEHIERADFVGLLDADQSVALRKRNRALRAVQEAVDFCNEEHFWAYKARDEYKDWRSQRPTRAQCLEHEKHYKSALTKIGRMLRITVEPEERWLRSAARNGNRALVELLLSSGLYAAQTALVRSAADHAAEHEQLEIANLLRAASGEGLCNP